MALSHTEARWRACLIGGVASPVEWFMALHGRSWARDGAVLQGGLDGKMPIHWLSFWIRRPSFGRCELPARNFRFEAIPPSEHTATDGGLS
jgi:hypothetical protein